MVAIGEVEINDDAVRDDVKPKLLDFNKIGTEGSDDNKKPAARTTNDCETNSAPKTKPGSNDGDRKLSAKPAVKQALGKALKPVAKQLPHKAWKPEAQAPDEDELNYEAGSNDGDRKLAAKPAVKKALGKALKPAANHLPYKAWKLDAELNYEAGESEDEEQLVDVTLEIAAADATLVALRKKEEVEVEEEEGGRGGEEDGENRDGEDRDGEDEAPAEKRATRTTMVCTRAWANIAHIAI
jgi:hypothetical protein